MPIERRASHAVPPPKKVKRLKREQAPPHDPSLKAHPPPKHRSFGTPPKPASRDKYAKTRATSPLVGPSAPLAPLARPQARPESRQPPMIRPSPPSPLRQSRATPSAPFLDALLLGQGRETRVGHARKAATRLATAQRAADAQIARVEPGSWAAAEARAAKFPYPPGWGAAGYQAPPEAVRAWERKTGLNYDAWVSRHTHRLGPSAAEMEARAAGGNEESVKALDAYKRQELGFFGSALQDAVALPGITAVSKGYFTPHTVAAAGFDAASLSALPGIGLVGKGVTTAAAREAMAVRAGLKAEGDVVRRGIVKHYKDTGYTRSTRRKIRGGADVVARAADRRAGGGGDTLAGYGGSFADVRSHLDGESLLGDGVMTQVKPVHRIAREKHLKNLRAKTNPRFAAEGKPPNPVTRTTTGHHIAGEISPQDWVARVQHVFDSPQEIEEAARWYETFEPLFRKHFGKDADRVMRAFAVSQANASPSGGLASVLRAMHKIDRGEEVGSIGSVVADSIEAALKGEMVDKKMAAKLSDFTDALRGKKRRTWMGNQAAGGAPAPVDVWGLRDLGYIDKGLLSRRGGRLKGGELNRARQIRADHGVDLTKLTHTPGVASGSRYERAAEKYEEITDHLNEIGFNGRSDWTPAQTQALGWSGIQRFFGSVPEDLVTAIERGKASAERGIRVTPIKKYEALIRKAARERFGVRKPTLEQQLKAEDVLHEQMARRSDDPEARKFLALYDDAVYARKLAEAESGPLFQSAPGEFSLSRLPEEGDADYAVRRERARELLYRDLHGALNPDALPEGWHGQRRTLVDPGGRLAPANEASFPTRPFFSPLYRAVDKMTDKFSPQELRGRLEKLGVKKDEVESSGLNTFLADQKSVTKEEVLSWLDSAYLKIEENERFRPRDDLLVGTGLLPVEDINSDLTKFGGEYMLTGGPESNPREITIRLPEREYGHLFAQTAHFPDPNILAHIRFSERTVDGKRTLMIEEIQSDWHQAGQKRGYKRPIEEHPDFAARTQRYEDARARVEGARAAMDDPPAVDNYREAFASQTALFRAQQNLAATTYTAKATGGYGGDWIVLMNTPDRGTIKIVTGEGVPPSGNFYGRDGAERAQAVEQRLEEQRATTVEMLKARQEEMNDLISALRERDEASSLLRALDNDVNRGVENAPFKKTWHELALKRMLAYAVEHGYERVAWTTGEQQAKRYNLASFFQRLEVEPKHAPEVGGEEYEEALQNAWESRAQDMEFDPRIDRPNEDDFIDPQTEQFDEQAYSEAMDDYHQQYDDARDEMEQEARSDFESGFEYRWENEHEDESGYEIRGWRHGDDYPSVTEDVPDDSLAEYVGPDLAERINRGETSFEGEALALGSGAKSALGASLFYDRKLKSFADKYLKKFKVKVEPKKVENETPYVDPYEGARFEVDDEENSLGGWNVWANFPDTTNPFGVVLRRVGSQESKQEAERLASEFRGGYRPGRPLNNMVTQPPHGETVHSVEITPQVKEFVEGGQPLFQAKGGDYRGAVEPSGDGRYILHLFANADASTVIHEMGHAIKRLLSPEDIATLAKHGLDDEETFARTFEAYFRNGEAPTMALRKVFRTMSQLLRGVYADVREIGETNLNPDTKAVFDRFMTKGGTSKQPPPLPLVEGALFQPRRRLGKPGEGQMNLFDTPPPAAATPPPVHPLLNPAAGPPPSPGAAVPPPPAAGGPPQQPPLPPAPTAAAATPPPPLPTLEEASAEVMRGMGPSARIYREEKGLRRLERGARTAEYERLMAKATSPEEEEAIKSATLSGPLPTLTWDRFTKMDPATVLTMKHAIREHYAPFGTQRTYTKIRTEQALDGIVSGFVPRPFERKLLTEVFGAKTTGQLVKSVPFWKKNYNRFINIIGIPRSILSSFDMSAPLRQGLVLAVTHPVLWRRNWKPMIKAFFSENIFDEIQTEIAARPTFDLMQRANVPFTDLATDMTVREEQFTSNYAEWLTGGFATKEGTKTPVRWSNRAYIAFLNKSRADLFDSLLKDLEKASPELNLESAEGLQTLDQLGRLVGNATGRGRLPGDTLKSAAPLLNQLLFAPKLLSSRIDTIATAPIHAVASYVRPSAEWAMHPVARKEAIRQVAGIVGLMMTSLSVMKLATGKDIRDLPGPRNADFTKIRIGNTRFDVAGGFAQPIRMVAQVSTGTVINSITGERLSLTTGGFGEKNRLSAFLRFLETKESPQTGILVNWSRGTDFEMQPFSYKREAYQRLTPLLVQDARDFWAEGDKTSGDVALTMAILGPAFFGLGTMSYSGKNLKRKPNVPVGGGSGGLLNDSDSGGSGLLNESGGGSGMLSP